MKKINILILASLLSSCGTFSLITTAKTIITTDLDRRSIGAIADDELIDLSLESWAINDKKLENAHINFNIYEKIVLVTGEVPSKNIKQYVDKQIKLQEPKIIKIFNNLIIASPSSLLERGKDSLIDAKIEIALNTQEVVNPVHIKVHTEDNVVYLMGDVTIRESKKAGIVAAKISGVIKVVKYFNYIDRIPQKEIDRAKQKEQVIKQREEELAKEKEKQRKKDILLQKIRELG